MCRSFLALFARSSLQERRGELPMMFRRPGFDPYLGGRALDALEVEVGL